MMTIMTLSDSSQFAPCKYAALQEFIFTTEQKQLAQGILPGFNHEALVEFNIKLQDRATRRNSASWRSLSRPRRATSWRERAARRGPRQTSDTSQQVTCHMMFLNSHDIHCQIRKSINDRGSAV
jgi:hypothetical protein